MSDMESRKPLSEANIGAGALYRAHARFVAGFLLRLGAPRDELEDLAQDVFLVAHRRGGFTPGAAKPTTWLAEIALRVWANQKRAVRRRPVEARSDMSGEASSTEADPERAAVARASLERVQACLDSLDPDHRAVFVLYELEGERCQDIADALHVPVGTVYRRLHTARKRFAEVHAQLSGGPDGRA